MSVIKALLLTDVVDSTRLAEKLGDSAMAEVWAAHDRVSRGCSFAGAGARSIRPTALLLFDNCADAVGYAMEYLPALAALPTPLAARGLHVGPVTLRENAPDDIARGAKPLEVEGLAKPITARVMALARGGQTLLLLPPAKRSASASTGWSYTATGASRVCPIPSSCSRSAQPGCPVHTNPPTATRRIASSDGRLLAAGQRDPEQLALSGDVVHWPRSRAGGSQEPARRQRVC